MFSVDECPNCRSGRVDFWWNGLAKCYVCGHKWFWLSRVLP